ncbi:MAG: methyltransferase domain-containing protein [Bacteroidetes bacterium]|jgi:2-isopropylmalate synthase|nr:methyltransferase domain-containing protein [Bacteroidota bacterium]
MTKQNWDANQYKNHASFVPELGSPVLKLLDPKPDERILDIGCGDGTLTVKIAEIARDVIGIDSSESMVLSARERGLNAVLMSGDSITYENEFDAVFTNAALHWIPDYESVISGVHRALKSSGRFVGEFGGKGNIETLVNAVSEVVDRHPEMGIFRNPWYFPSDTEYQEQLEKHGFVVNHIELIPRPTPLKTGVKEWLKIFANHVISGMPPALEEQFLNETEQLVRPDLYSEDKGWQADYVRIRFSARKP